MTPITTTKGDWLFVPVPTAISSEGNGYNKIYTGDGEYEFHSLPYSELPPVKTGIKVSEATFFCLSNNITEEQAGGVVEIHPVNKLKYILYENPLFDVDIFNEFIAAHRWSNTALESIHSLMKSHSLTETNYVILKVKKP